MPEKNGIQERLRAAQASVKELDQRREKLAREAGIEEHKINELITQLKTLGVLNAAKLSIQELEDMLAKRSRALEQKLETVEIRVTEANGLLAEYDAVVTSAV